MQRTAFFAIYVITSYSIHYTKLYEPLLGETEVPPLPHDSRSELRSVDPDGVVGPVADILVLLEGCLDVSPDPPVPEEIDGGGG